MNAQQFETSMNSQSILLQLQMIKILQQLKKGE